MIRVTVELIPGGDESKKRKIGELTICNEGTGTSDVGNYKGVLVAEYTKGRHGRVQGFRRNTGSVWTLIGAFLVQMGHANFPIPAVSQKSKTLLDG